MTNTLFMGQNHVFKAKKCENSPQRKHWLEPVISTSTKPNLFQESFEVLASIFLIWLAWKFLLQTALAATGCMKGKCRSLGVVIYCSTSSRIGGIQLCLPSLKTSELSLKRHSAIHPELVTVIWLFSNACDQHIQHHEV